MPLQIDDNYNRRPGDSFGDSAPLLLSLEARVRGVRGACGTRALQVPSRTGAPVELPRAGSSAPPNLPSTQCAALFRWRRLRWRERADLVGLVRASQWGGGSGSCRCTGGAGGTGQHREPDIPATHILTDYSSEPAPNRRLRWAGRKGAGRHALCAPWRSGPGGVFGVWGSRS